MAPEFYLSAANFTPLVVSHFDYKILRRTKWKVQNRDGSYGVFVSWWIVNHLQIYHGTAKCDGTKSYLNKHITMTDRPDELRAFRWRTDPPGPPVWDNQGGT